MAPMLSAMAAPMVMTGSSSSSHAHEAVNAVAQNTSPTFDGLVVVETIPGSHGYGASYRL